MCVSVYVCVCMSVHIFECVRLCVHVCVCVHVCTAHPPSLQVLLLQQQPMPREQTPQRTSETPPFPVAGRVQRGGRQEGDAACCPCCFLSHPNGCGRTAAAVGAGAGFGGAGVAGTGGGATAGAGSDAAGAGAGMHHGCGAVCSPLRWAYDVSLLLRLLDCLCGVVGCCCGRVPAAL